MIKAIFFVCHVGALQAAYLPFYISSTLTITIMHAAATIQTQIFSLTEQGTLRKVETSAGWLCSTKSMYA